MKEEITMFAHITMTNYYDLFDIIIYQLGQYSEQISCTFNAYTNTYSIINYNTFIRYTLSNYNLSKYLYKYLTKDLSTHKS